MPQATQFILTLLSFLVLAFLLQIGYLHYQNLPLFANKIIAAYVVNFVLAVSMYFTLFFLQYKYTSQLGFIFMAGSFVKFILFFVFFYPSYKQDGLLSSLEFGAFFIPYAISLVFETLGIIKFLKK